jgi:hypothetical protein
MGILQEVKELLESSEKDSLEAHGYFNKYGWGNTGKSKSGAITYTHSKHPNHIFQIKDGKITHMVNSEEKPLPTMHSVHIKDLNMRLATVKNMDK